MTLFPCAINKGRGHTLSQLQETSWYATFRPIRVSHVSMEEKAVVRTKLMPLWASVPISFRFENYGPRDHCCRSGAFTPGVWHLKDFYMTPGMSYCQINRTRRKMRRAESKGDDVPVRAFCQSILPFSADYATFWLQSPPFVEFWTASASVEKLCPSFINIHAMFF